MITSVLPRQQCLLLSGWNQVDGKYREQAAVGALEHLQPGLLSVVNGDRHVVLPSWQLMLRRKELKSNLLVSNARHTDANMKTYTICGLSQQGVDARLAVKYFS